MKTRYPLLALTLAARSLAFGQTAANTQTN